MAIIPVSGGKAQALVDDKDYACVSERRWYLSNGYAVTSVGYTNALGKRKHHSVTMHQFLCGCPLGYAMVIDHINRNRLDNRRDNLRITTQSVNSRNSAVMDQRIIEDMLYIYYHKRHKTWRVWCKGAYLGVFDDLAEARTVRDNHLASMTNQV